MTKRRVCAKPNGYWIDEFSIQKTDQHNWTLAMTVTSCGNNIPLINIVGGEPSNENADNKMYHLNNANFLVSRNLAASPPITGTFDLSFLNNTINGMYSCQKSF